MKPGTQIIYVPHHANNDITHADVEFGFVTSGRGEVHFCRYWLKGRPGELRTVANSECTPTENIVEHESVRQSVVDKCLADIAIPHGN